MSSLDAEDRVVGTSTRGRIIRSVGEAGVEVDGTWYQNFNLVEYDDVEYVFSHRAILTLVVTAACNAGCHFCSNEIIFTPSGPFLERNDRLERVKEFALLADVKKVAYTGGEPTLHPQKLLELVGAMSPGFHRSRIHTSGWGAIEARAA
ncbi:radical SAM protein [Streptomyces sp. MMS24-I2-30]|uniref:radical SAM protein n=1 Tax=Streptomyces sp. MMS24-I2-30 TaxID=3351564 RepID=UPI003896C5C2